MRRATLTILTLLTTIGLFAQKQCVIKGEIVSRDSKGLLVRKCSESFRSFLNKPTKVSIKKGKFDYTFQYVESEAYELIFEDELEKGSWRAITFFPTNGVIELKLHPQDEWEKNTIKGGELNAEFEEYQINNRKLFDKRRKQLMETQDDLSERDEYDSPEYKELTRQLRATKPDDHEARIPIFQKREELEKTHARYTEEAKELFIDPYDSLLKVELVWRYEYIKNNPSIVSFYFIWSDVEMKMKDNPQVTQLVTSVFPIYEKNYPEHIYTKIIGKQVDGLRTIDIGNKYIDVKVPSIDGDTIQLSSVIQNHVSLIDMWGSWCGPCIAKSRLVVPIYEQYKGKGFKVVGIAREFKNTDAVKRRISKEQFSWLNLVELDDKQNIWNTYGISNGTGLMVLVDRDGTILSIDPKPEELEKILQQKLD
ncbi:MAG: redoxin domain-containing protein [Cyclobacteriaceae bacterium]|nr:redoxin domain-containing protein [Cyclobacteriaceae bacterium]